MNKMIKPPRLKEGDTVGIIAPASSASLIKEENLAMAQKMLETLRIKSAYSKNAFNKYQISPEGIKEKIEDIHDVFSNKKVKAVMAVIGGYTSNQLLPYLDFELIKKNPKILIGFSDITALQNAIFVKTGLITFSGPCFATLAQTQEPFGFEKEYFKKILIDGASDVEIRESEYWADDEWWKTPKNKRELKKNEGWRIIKKGRAKGIIIGGNLSTFLLLVGTPYCPNFNNKILFLEEDPEIKLGMIERNLFQLRETGNFSQIKGLVIGRFGSRLNLDVKDEIDLIKGAFGNYKFPIITNVDFGHTNPMITFPVGGQCEINTDAKLIKFIGQQVT